jgi:type II secretion system protein C
MRITKFDLGSVSNASMLMDRLGGIVMSRRSRWLVYAVLGLLLVLAVVRIVVLTLAEAEKPIVTFPAPAATGQRQGINLFPSAGPGEVSEDLAEAAVNAQLQGVIHSSDRALANLMVNGKKEAVFKVGDDIAGGVTIETIEATRVVVRERGQLRSITLKSLLDGRQGGQIELAPQPAEDRAGALRSSIQVEFTPVVTANGSSGMRIEHMGESLAALGLFEEDDVLVAVEGRPLADVFADPELQASLREKRSVSVTLERQGAEVNLDVETETLNTLIAP